MDNQNIEFVTGSYISDSDKNLSNHVSPTPFDDFKTELTGTSIPTRTAPTAPMAHGSDTSAILKVIENTYKSIAESKGIHKKLEFQSGTTPEEAIRESMLKLAQNIEESSLMKKSEEARLAAVSARNSSESSKLNIIDISNQLTAFIQDFNTKREVVRHEVLPMGIDNPTNGDLQSGVLRIFENFTTPSKSTGKLVSLKGVMLKYTRVEGMLLDIVKDLGAGSGDEMFWEDLANACRKAQEKAASMNINLQTTNITTQQ